MGRKFGSKKTTEAKGKVEYQKLYMREYRRDQKAQEEAKTELVRVTYEMLPFSSQISEFNKNVIVQHVRQGNYIEALRISRKVLEIQKMDVDSQKRVEERKKLDAETKALEIAVSGHVQPLEPSPPVSVERELTIRNGQTNQVLVSVKEGKKK